MTYEAPAVAERAEVGGPLIGTTPFSPPLESPAWRRDDEGKGDAHD